MKKEVVINIFINSCVLFLLLGEYIIFCLDSSIFSLKFVEVQLLFMFAYSVVAIRIIKKQWISIYSIFLTLTCLFLFVRPFLHLFNFSFMDMVGYNEQQWFRLYDNFSFSHHTLVKINFVLIFTLIGLNIGYLIGYKKYYFTSLKKNLKTSYSKIFNIKIAYFLYIVGAISFIIKVALYVNILRQYGYEYLYTGNYNLPWFIRVFDDFLYIGYILVMVNFPSKKRAVVLSIFTIFLYSTSLLTGMRGEFFTVLFSIIWMFSKLYNWQPKLYNILLFGLSMVLLGQSVLMIKYSHVTYEFVDVFDLILLFFYSQGVSILTVGYVIEFSDMYASFYQGVRYFTAPFISMFLTLTGQKQPVHLAAPTDIYNFSDMLSSYIDLEGYKLGVGYGSSYVVNIFSFGADVLGVLIGAMLLGFVVAWMSYKLIYKKYGLFICMIMLPFLFWTPRSTVSGLLMKYLFAFIILYGLVFMFNFLKTKKK